MSLQTITVRIYPWGASIFIKIVYPILIKFNQREKWGKRLKYLLIKEIPLKDSTRTSLRKTKENWPPRLSLFFILALKWIPKSVFEMWGLFWIETPHKHQIWDINFSKWKCSSRYDEITFQKIQQHVHT